MFPSYGFLKKLRTHFMSQQKNRVLKGASPRQHSMTSTLKLNLIKCLGNSLNCMQYCSNSYIGTQFLLLCYDTCTINMKALTSLIYMYISLNNEHYTHCISVLLVHSMQYDYKHHLLMKSFTNCIHRQKL